VMESPNSKIVGLILMDNEAPIMTERCRFRWWCVGDFFIYLLVACDWAWEVFAESRESRAESREPKMNKRPKIQMKIFQNFFSHPD
jgi:hypothetical protein